MCQAIGETGDIDINDTVFGVHGFMLSSICLTQVFMYDRGQQKAVNWFVVAFLILMCITIFTFFVIEILHPDINQAYSTIRMAGYSKAAVTLVKYMPQVYLNWKR